MLVVGVFGQAAGTVFVSGAAFLLPLLHSERGIPLAQAGVLVAAPTLGMVLTLVAWGALADRIGERWVIAGGLALTALAALGAALAQGYVAVGLFLLAGGMAAASTNAASGRVVVGWFPKQRRGLAMGIRQMCQPLGVALAALVIPPLAATGGIGAAMLFPLVLTAVGGVAAAIVIVNPPRPERSPGAAPAAANPYRRTSALWRIHAVSVLLVVPQFTISTFGLVWLTAERHWSATAAGVLVGVAQFVGAIGRIGVGVLSDRVGSRMRPLRWVTYAALAIMFLLGLTDAAAGWLAPVAYLIAAAITVADNGLSFTAVAEIAGPFWSGRALGMQNTSQFLAASIVAPGVGALIGLVGYPLAFALVGLAPAVALPLVPRADEHAPEPEPAAAR
jgi:sugar phosphate permease